VEQRLVQQCNDVVGALGVKPRGVAGLWLVGSPMTNLTGLRTVTVWQSAGR
jgi:hypothetical protein